MENKDINLNNFNKTQNQVKRKPKKLIFIACFLLLLIAILFLAYLNGEKIMTI